LVTVVRLDGLGTVQWVRTYNFTLTPLGADGKGIAPTSDGGFVIVAEYLPNFPPQPNVVKDLLVFRIDAAGELVWGRIIGNSFNDARAGQIETTPDGGVVVVGSRTVAGFFLPREVWVVKLNGDGTIAWSSLYFSVTGNGVLDESGTRLVVTPDGGPVIAGRRREVLGPFGPDTDLVLMRLDSVGEIVGQRRLDSIGESTTPLSLRAASDGGFLVAAGADSDCRLCPFPPEGATRFLVGHLDSDLDCPGGCTVPYDFVRRPGPSTGGAIGFQLGAMTGTSVDTQFTQIDITSRRYSCDHGFFGAPPVFDPASIDAGRQNVYCDRTEYIEAAACAVGIPGAQATSPVTLSVTYDSLRLMARVVDDDSTPDQDDVVSVTATISATLPPNFHSAIPMLDDGSVTSLPNLFRTVTSCREDPGAGVCSCDPQNVPAFSGDVVGGDGIYTLQTSLTLPTVPPPPLDVGTGCVHEGTRSALLSFDPGTPLSVIVRATDRIGNVASTAATVTPSVATLSCSGDACGCCLLVSPNPAAECSGLPGMPSPDFPDGLCRAF